MRVLEESRMTDSANDGSGHIEKALKPPAVPNLSTSSVRTSPVPSPPHLPYMTDRTQEEPICGRPA